MRVGPVVHGGLLLVALGVAYQSWTREPAGNEKMGTHVVWSEDPGSFTGLSYDGDGKSVKIERRGEGADRYLWGTVTRTTPAPKPPGADPHAGIPGAPGQPPAPTAKPVPAPPAKPGATPPAAAPPARPGATPSTTPAPGPAKAPERSGPAKAGDGASVPPGGPADPSGIPAALAAPPTGASNGMPPAVTVREFPIGPEGDVLIKNFSTLHALRSLGVLDETKKTEFGLQDGTENLTVFFGAGKSQTLVVGAKVFGGSDRYVLEPGSGKGYVISTEIMKQIDGAETALGLKELHAYEADTLDRLEIDTSYGKKSLVRKVIEDEKGKQTGYADAAKPDVPDQTLTNFVSQIDKLKPTEYDPKLTTDRLEKVLSIAYRDKAGKQIGTFELFKQDAADVKLSPLSTAKPGEAAYFIRTEQTRVLGRVSRIAVERLESNDLPSLFGQAPKPTAPRSVPADQGAPSSIARPEAGAAPANPGAPGAPPGAPGKPPVQRPITPEQVRGMMPRQNAPAPR